MHLNVNVINVNTFCCSTFLSICEPFIEGHQIKAMFPNDRARRANKPLGIAYVDVFGRMKVVVFIDDSTTSESNLEMSKWNKRGSHGG